MLKAALYIPTTLAALVLAFYELRLKRQLIDKYSEKSAVLLGDLGLISDLKERVRNESLLGRLAANELLPLRVVATLKFVMVAALVLEVILLQR